MQASLKEEVLALLCENAGNPVSGSEMAARLGVTRNAVWKAIRQLTAEGCRIEAATNRGYTLADAGDLLCAPLVRKDLNTARLGRTLIIEETLGSSNELAKRLAAKGAVDGTVVIARQQTGGKGRRGRSFFSPPGSGLYMSLLLRPSLAAADAGLLTSLTAVAVAEAIESLSPITVGIKWVNDLFVGGKKLCGILTEASMDMESGTLEYMVVGIGVNVGRIDFPPELSEIATSIENENPQPVRRAALAAAILNRLEARLSSADTGAFLEESRRRSIVLGKTVTVIQGTASYPAKAIGIDEEGRLILQTADGVRHLGSGEISVRLE